MTAAGLAADALALLTAAPPSPERESFLAHLSSYGDAGLRREGPPEHFTASAVVFSADRSQVLLVLHKKARLWLQPGGHFEPGDATVVGAALREATEETGVAGLHAAPGALYLDRHLLAGSFGRCRAHLDLRIAATAPPGAAVSVSEESDDVRWWPADRLPEDTDPGLADCIATLRG